MYSSSPYHLESIVGWPPVIFLLGFHKHLLRMVVHLLPFRCTVLGSTASVFLDHVSRDWGDVTVVLVELRWTSRRLHTSSTAAIDYSHFPVGIAVRTLLFGRICAKFEDLGVVQVGDQIFRFFAQLVDLLRLAQVLMEWFLMFVVLELLDQLLDVVLACCILLLDCRKRYSRSSVIHGVFTSFTVTLRIAWRFPRWSCVLALWILLAELRVWF